MAEKAIKLRAGAGSSSVTYRPILYTRILYAHARDGSFQQSDLTGDGVTQSFVSKILQRCESKGYVETDGERPKIYTLTDSGHDRLEGEIQKLYRRAAEVYVNQFNVSALEEVKQKFEGYFPMVDFDEAAPASDMSATELHDIVEAVFGSETLAPDAQEHREQQRREQQKRAELLQFLDDQDGSALLHKTLVPEGYTKSYLDEPVDEGVLVSELTWDGPKSETAYEVAE